MYEPKDINVWMSCGHGACYVSPLPALGTVAYCRTCKTWHIVEATRLGENVKHRRVIGMGKKPGPAKRMS